jgi:uncharacterized protein YkwD
MKAFIIAIIAGGILGWGARTIVAAPTPVATAITLPVAIPTPDQTQEMYALVNEVRDKEGLLPLRYNKELEDSAIKKACDMRDKHYFDHYGPDGSEPWHFFKEAGYQYSYAGENLIKDLPNAKDAMILLLASTTHRDNLLATRYHEVGIGKCGQYTVQHFGSL